jgi:hypothetical protein
MKRSELKQIVKEEISKQINLSEGLLDKAANALINKMIKSKYGKFFDELYKDPEYQEALKGLKHAVERIEISTAAAKKSIDDTTKTYNEYAKKYGKKAADAIIDKVYHGKYASYKPKRR